MDVALPDGQTATFRDEFFRGDRREARRGMVFITAPDGSRRTDGALIEDLTGRIITRMLVGWTLELPLPGTAQSEDLQQKILDRVPSRTVRVLEHAVQPWVSEVLDMGGASRTFVHVASGEQFPNVGDEQAARLSLLPDFAEVEGPGPKTSRTAITSSASPDGPTTPE
jgi:hypothetical protein